ncbi:MAG: four-carbon acid sugar kinase family protein [Vulcanococcus sp.]
MALPLKLIVLDDDPTGSQTVHSCPLLLRWDANSLRRGLAHTSPLLFVLANTRALDPEAARERVREICQALKPLLAELVGAGPWQRWMVICRGDSTLRGHFPLEAEVVAEELGPFHAGVLAPAGQKGRRTTVDGVHLLHGEPVHRSAFARDGLFGYGTSHLPAWVEQKTGGRLSATVVQQITLAELDAAAAGPSLARLVVRLRRLEGQPWLAVDAQQPPQLEALGQAVAQLSGEGLRFLAQSAASLINGLVPLPPQPLDATGLAQLRRRSPEGRPLPGLVVVGSHVPLADQQLACLLQDPASAPIELPVAKLARVWAGPTPLELLASLEQAWVRQLREACSTGQTPVLFTSRGEHQCGSASERRRLGLELAALMARLAAAMAPQLGYLISKGGITTHTLLADGLQCDQVELQGQLLPGLSLVLAGDLPVITFPGNLGDRETLHQAWSLLAAVEG